MKKMFFIGILCFCAVGYAQVISEDEFRQKVKEAQDKCVGAHASVVSRANEDFAKELWGKKIRFNNAEIIRFFDHSSGEKVVGGVDISKGNKKTFAYEYDQQVTAKLLTDNGLRVTQSYNTQWLKARQPLLYAESKQGGQKTILELYCPQQSFLEILRVGQTQSIEFLVTGFWGNPSTSDKIVGVITQVHTEKQVVKCSGGHEFDKSLGYKFCPTCGETLE